MIKKLLIAALSLSVVTSIAPAKSKGVATRAGVSGTVIHGGHNVGGAKVWVRRFGLIYHSRAVRTGPHGNFHANRSPGVYRVHAYKRGFGSGTAHVTVAAGSTPHVTIALYRHVPHLHSTTLIGGTTVIEHHEHKKDEKKAETHEHAATPARHRLAAVGTSSFHRLPSKPVTK